MKREETIAKYLETYLEGKSDEQRAAFLSKDINKQYSAIMAWKRRGALKKVTEGGITATEVMKHIKGLQGLIPMVSSLTRQQIDSMLAEVEKVKDLLNGFEAERARREIEDLERRKRELDEKIARLREKC